jgi:hypothetical protein
VANYRKPVGHLCKLSQHNLHGLRCWHAEDGADRDTSRWRYCLSAEQAANAITVDCPWGSHHSCDKPAGAKAPQRYEIEDLIVGAEFISTLGGGTPPLRSLGVSYPSTGEDKELILRLLKDGTEIVPLLRLFSGQVVDGS